MSKDKELEEKKKLQEEKTQAEAEAQDVWTRNQEYGGVGEPLDPESIEVEDSDPNDFIGLEADEEIDMEQELMDEYERMERGE